MESTTFKHNQCYIPHDISAEMTEAGRIYTVPGGHRYESITTALGKYGDKSGLDEWRNRVGEEEANRVSRVASSRGTEMHEICEKYLYNDLNPTKGFMPDAIGFFKSLKPVLNQGIEVVHMQECGLYSHKYKLAGRVDLICQTANKLTVLDFKTSRKKKKREWIEGYYLQLTAYAQMFYELYDVMPERAIILIAVEYSSPQVFIFNPADWLNHDFFKQRLSLNSLS